MACGNSRGQLKKNWNDQVVMNEMGEGGGGLGVMKKKPYGISRGLGF